MRRVFPVLGCLLLLSGCATGLSRQHAMFLNSLVGESETDLVRQIGVPNRTFEVGGHRFLAYDRSRTDVIPGFGGWGGGWGGWGDPYGWGWGGGFGAIPPEVVRRSCETTFEIDNGHVTSWTLRGNDCH